MNKDIINKVLNGEEIDKKEAMELLREDLGELCSLADSVKNKFCGKRVGLCSIINGKSGNCGENCKFCAQSAHNRTDADCFGFIDEETIVDDCKKHCMAGVHRYSVVTSGRALAGEDFKRALRAYERMSRECGKIGLCASHGLLEREQFKALKASGVTRYHCNIETSPNYFNNICTSHSFEDKLRAIGFAKEAGLEVCSGGIIGMGECMEDRVDMALALQKIGVSSIPINILTPIKNTPLESVQPLTEEEILRTVAIFRLINPKTDIRLAAGRSRLRDKGIRVFFSGANATITGDFLTTTGATISGDRKMLLENGFEV